MNFIACVYERKLQYLFLTLMILALYFYLLVWSFPEQIGWIKSLEIFEWNPHQIMQTVEGLQELLQLAPGSMKILKILILVKTLNSEKYSIV